MWREINYEFQETFDSNIEKWQPTQDEIDIVIEDMKERIKFTIEECGDLEMAEDYKKELQKLQINTLKKKQQFAKDYIKETFDCTPVDALLNDNDISKLYEKLITE